MRRVNYRAIASSSSPGFHGTPFVTVGNAPAGDTVDDCDYLDDGSGAQLYLAITDTNALPYGGLVYVRRGVYNITSSTPLTIRSNTHVSGEGAGSTIILGASTDFGDLVNIRGTNIVFERMTVSLNESGTSTGTSAILIDKGSKDVVVRDVKVRGMIDLPSTNKVFSGIYLPGTGFHQNIVIDSCMFETESSSSISATDMSASIVVASVNGLDADIPDTTRISDCSFADMADGAKNHCGIAILGGCASISGCTFRRQGNYGIWLSPVNSIIDGSSVIGCTILHDDGKWSVLVFNESASSLHINGVTISGNTVRGTITTVGITAYSDSATMDTNFVSICDNYVEAVGGTGVWLKAGAGASVNSCLVDGNILKQSTTPLQDAGVGTVVGDNVV